MIINSSYNLKAKNNFIVIEGANGAGKSTLAEGIKDFLEEYNKKTLITREPGGTKVGNKIRDILLNQNKNPLTPKAELFLFAADRSQHLWEKIIPATKNNTIVISDRFYYSTIAFQGYGRQLDLNMVKEVNFWAIDNFYPDLVILLDIDPITGLKRTKERKDNNHDSFEAEKIAFHKRLREGFLQIAKNFKEPF